MWARRGHSGSSPATDVPGDPARPFWARGITCAGVFAIESNGRMQGPDSGCVRWRGNPEAVARHTGGSAREIARHYRRNRRSRSFDEWGFIKIWEKLDIEFPPRPSPSRRDDDPSRAVGTRSVVVAVTRAEPTGTATQPLPMRHIRQWACPASRSRGSSQRTLLPGVEPSR